MKKLKIITIALVALGAFLSSCDSDDNNISFPVPISIPETITISEIGLYPEGIDFNTINNQFLVGSTRRSEVGYVDPETGVYTAFVTDPNLVGVTGVYTDEIRNLLLVVSGNLAFSANTNANNPFVAYLGIYNLETGALIQGVDLTEVLPADVGAFANDIAVDNTGNIYVTDSFSPVVYRVDGVTFEASIFVNGGDDFAPTPGAFGLNGIVFTNGNLIVSKTENGDLFKIPVSNPASYSIIDAPAFVGADGLELDSDNNIVLVENSLGTSPGTRLFSTTDNWDTATLVSSFAVASPESFPATAALASDGEVYVLNAYLGLALNGDFTQSTFSIQRTN